MANIVSGLGGLWATQGAARAAFMGGRAMGALGGIEKFYSGMYPSIGKMGAMGRRTLLGAMIGGSVGGAMGNIGGFISPGDDRGRIRGSIVGGFSGALKVAT